MKSIDLLENMGDISGKYIMEASELNKVQIKKVGRKTFRLTLLAAVLSVMLLGLTAYAAMDYLGIFDMLRGTRFELAPEAEEYVETQSSAQEAEGWSCRIVESLTDAADYAVTVGVSGGDKYILAPTYCSPSDSAMEIGMEAGMTLEELARKLGKTLLFVGAGMEERDRLGIAVETEICKSQSLNEMTILITGQKLNDSPVLDASCMVTVVEEGKYDFEDIQRVHLPVTMNAAPLQESFQMRPVGSDEVLGIKFLKVTASKSALGWMVEFQVDWPKEGITEDFKTMTCEELYDYEGGGFVFWDNAPSVCQWTKAKGEITDKLHVQFISWDNEILGTMEFERVL